MTDQTSGGSPVERSEIEDRYKWKLELIFPDWESWEAAFAEIEASLPDLAGRQGTLARVGRPAAGNHRGHARGPAAAGKSLRLCGHEKRRGHPDRREHRPQGAHLESGGAGVRGGQLVRVRGAGHRPRPSGRAGGRRTRARTLRHFFHNIHRGREHTLSAELEALLAGRRPDGPRGRARSSTPSTTPICSSIRSKTRRGTRSP